CRLVHHAGFRKTVKTLKASYRLLGRLVVDAVYRDKLKRRVEIGYYVKIILKRSDLLAAHSRRKSVGGEGQGRLVNGDALGNKLRQLFYAVIIALYAVPGGFVDYSGLGQ